jgi:hypothetical protein
MGGRDMRNLRLRAGAAQAWNYVLRRSDRRCAATISREAAVTRRTASSPLASTSADEAANG